MSSRNTNQEERWASNIFCMQSFQQSEQASMTGVVTRVVYEGDIEEVSDLKQFLAVPFNF